MDSYTFRGHLIRHLRELAHFALPRTLYDEEETRSVGSNSAHFSSDSMSMSMSMYSMSTDGGPYVLDSA